MVNKFDKLTSVSDATQALLHICRPVGNTSRIDLEYADNRIISRDIVSPRDFPHYDHCVVDGYAVRAADTAGAGILALSGTGKVAVGTCVQVHTGGALPDGADAVVRREDTVGEKEGIKVLVRPGAGDNIVPRGTTLKKGDVIYKEGTQLKPTDIGTLGRLGFTEVEAYEKPRVLIIPTGDELAGRGEEPGPGMVNDGNGIMCFAMVKRFGGKPALHDIVRDDPEAIKEALREGLKYDLIITSGGTSVGFRDHIEEAVSEAGKVLIHGVGIKPGRPMGVGYVEGDGKWTPMLFLPGVMEACAVTALTFAGTAIRYIGHYPEPGVRHKMVRLMKSVHGFPGARSVVKLHLNDGMATPMNVVGEPYPRGEYAYLILPEGSEGHEAGEEVESVYLE